jgi:hypothetical protein
MRRIARTAADLEAAARELAELELSGPLEIIARPHRQTRSAAQNALLHVWCAVIADETGCAPDAAKEAVCAEILGHEVIDGPRGPITRRRSTSGLGVGAFGELLDRMQAWASLELGIVLPRPDQPGYAEMMERFR